MSIRICVIGGGAWGENHIRTLLELGALGAVVEPNAVRSAQLAEKYDTEILTLVDDAIKKKYDGYVVATPAKLHYEIGKKLLNEGLPTIIEKPMTLSADEALELVKLAEEKDVSFMVAHILLFHPAIRKIKELVTSDSIGQLYYLYSTRIKFGVIRTEENVFWSFAPHDIAVLNYLVGSPVEKINISQGCFLQENICDYALAQMDYPGGIKAHILTSWLHPFKEQRLVAVGSKGMVWFDDASDKKVYYSDKHVEWDNGQPVLAQRDAVVVPYDKKLPLTEELKYFIEHLDTKPEISSGRAGYDVVKVLETVQDSIRRTSNGILRS